MTDSLTFNSVDLSLYGLILNRSENNRTSFNRNTIQLDTRAFASRGKREALQIDTDFTIIGTNLSDSQAKLANIKRVLTTVETGELIFDNMPDVYYNASLSQLDCQRLGHKDLIGTISFLCADPYGYSTIETDQTDNITTDPKAVTVTVGGSALTLPVYTLTAGGSLSGPISVKNNDTGEELVWDSSMVSTDELEIDTEHWIVKKNGTASMTDVSGQFPRLLPGQDNHIVVTGFGTTGTLQTVFRSRFI
jgi:putative phage tail component, N-terminal domain